MVVDSRLISWLHCFNPLGRRSAQAAIEKCIYGWVRTWHVVLCRSKAIVFQNVLIIISSNYFVCWRNWCCGKYHTFWYSRLSRQICDYDVKLIPADNFQKISHGQGSSKLERIVEDATLHELSSFLDEQYWSFCICRYCDWTCIATKRMEIAQSVIQRVQNSRWII